MNLNKRVFKPILERARLPRKKFSPYALRHSCASLLLASGRTDLRTVADRLRHAKATLTLDTYAHVLSGLQAQATELLDKILSGK